MQQPILRKSNHRKPRTFAINRNHKPIHQNMYDITHQINNPQTLDIHPSSRQQTFGRTPQKQSQIHYQNPSLLQDSNINSVEDNLGEIGPLLHQNNQQNQNAYNNPATGQRDLVQSKIMDYEHSNIFLPQLKIGKAEEEIRSFGIIKKQNHDKLRYNSSNRESYDSTDGASPQKTYNKLALSLMGVKRQYKNKSCLEKRNSMAEIEYKPWGSKLQQNKTQKKLSGLNKTSDQKVQKKMSNNKIRKQSEEVEVYQHSRYPFRADDIDYLKREIESTVKQKWEIRASSYSQFKKRKYPEIISVKNPKNLQKHSQNQEHFYEFEKQQFFELSVPHGRIIKIDHKTGITHLKSLLTIDEFILQKCLFIEAPQFFTKPPSQFQKLSSLKNVNSLDLVILQNQASYIFSSLQIPINNLNVKRYSNCVLVINGNLCIVWHINSENSKKNIFPKRYLGSWKNKYFDEGVKEGLGVQWAPGRYIFYGQFQNNKRNGFGVMRTAEQRVIVGFWKAGKFTQFGIQRNIPY